VISACADIVANADGAPNGQTTHGELLKPISSLSLKRNAATPATVDDSGTESGDEVNQKILFQVRGALANLESALPALDPLRRSSVVELLAKLQASLKPTADGRPTADGQATADGKPTPPPRKCWNKKASAHARHTVGVSCEELQDARRWLEEIGYAGVPPPPPPPPAEDAGNDATVPPQVAAPKTFRPVKFVPPPPKRAHYAEDYVPEPQRHLAQTASFACPPPQHAVVENVDGRSNDDDDGDDDTSESSSSLSAGIGPSDDDDDGRPVSSARRLLQFAASNNDRRPGREYRHGKRVFKSRRADAAADGERSSGDKYGGRRRPSRDTSSGGVPTFEPKTASDQKYVALLRQTREDEAAASHTPRNPLNGKLQGNWSNRFGRIKTAFERGTAVIAAPPKKGNAAKTFWHDICKCPSDDSIAYRPTKVTFKPGNGFSHATRSAFKPVAAAPHRPSAFLEPPPPETRPVHLPLYNSSVTTAHRPFIYPSSPSSQSDLTTASRSASPYSVDAAPLQQCATVSRIMGSPQTATVTAKGRATTAAAAAAASVVRAPRPPPRSPRLVPQQRSPATSPVRMPSVLQKSESWHQMIMGQSRAAPHEARGRGVSTDDEIARKQDMVRQRLSRPSGGRRPAKCPSPGAKPVVKLDDDMDKVDDTFESLFKESTTKTGKKPF